MNTKITAKQIFTKNLIREPYYAIQELTLVNGELRAVIPIEQPLGNEIGPITFAETARHLAILGSCAITLAKNDDENSYFYAALVGKQKRCITKEIIIDKGNKLYGYATSEIIDRRKARAMTRLLLANTNELIGEVEVEFCLIPEKIFDRKYEKFKCDTSSLSSSYNPYRQLFPLQDIKFNDDSVSFSLGIIKPDYCSGHFPNYPILPVAILSYYQSKAVSLLLDHVSGMTNTRYMFTNCLLEANDFAFAGTTPVFSAKLISKIANQYEFYTAVTADNGITIAVATASLMSL